MFLVSSCSCFCPIQWSQVLSREWRCSWSSADRRCSNYIWVIDNYIAYWGASYIRDLTVGLYWFRQWLFGPKPLLLTNDDFIMNLPNFMDIWIQNFLLFSEKRIVGHLNIKMPSYQHSNSYYKVRWCNNQKMVLQLSYLYNGNPFTWRDSLYWNRATVSVYNITQSIQCWSDVHDKHHTTSNKYSQNKKICMNNFICKNNYTTICTNGYDFTADNIQIQQIFTKMFQELYHFGFWKCGSNLKCVILNLHCSDWYL